MENTDKTKCNCCRCWKPNQDFINKDKVVKSCEKCRKLQAQNRETTKEKRKEKMKEYYVKNKEKIKEKTKEYRKDNKEHIIEYRKKHYEANKDKINEKRKERYKSNKEKVKCDICNKEMRKDSINKHKKNIHK